jgi:hypothetical protein
VGKRHSVTALFVLLAAFWIPSAAVCQTSLEKEARELFGQAVEAYAEADYNSTVTKLTAAYKLFPNPGFLFNLGLTWEKKGDPARAATFYRRYLTESKKKDESLSRRIELLDSAAAGATLTPRDVEPPMTFESRLTTSPTDFELAGKKAGVATVAPVEPAPAVKKKYGPWPWVTLATTGATLVTAITFAALSTENYNAATHLSEQITHTPQDEARLASLKETTRTQSIVADTFFGVAAASAIVTLALFLTESYPKKAQKKIVEVSPMFGAEGQTGLALSGQF